MRVAAILAALLASALVPLRAAAQVSDPPPRVDTEVELEDQIAGILGGAALGAVNLSGPAARRLERAIGGTVSGSFQFESVSEVRIAFSWAKASDPLATSEATMRSLHVEVLWAFVQRRIVLQGGPLVALHRMERAFWSGGPEDAPGFGGVVMLIAPIHDRVELDATFSLSSIQLTDPAHRVTQDHDPMWSGGMAVGLRYRLR